MDIDSIFEDDDSTQAQLTEILQKNKLKNPTVNPLTEKQDRENAIQTLKESLQANLEYKILLEDQLNMIEDSQKRNNILQRDLRMISSLKGAYHPSNSKKYGNMLHKRKAELLFFVDRNGEEPPPNEDMVTLQQQSKNVKIAYKTKKWTDDEKENLRKGIQDRKSVV